VAPLHGGAPVVVGDVTQKPTSFEIVSDCVVCLVDGIMEPFAHQPEGVMYGHYKPRATPRKVKAHSGLQILYDDDNDNDEDDNNNNNIMMDAMFSNGETHLLALAGTTAFLFEYQGASRFMLVSPLEGVDVGLYKDIAVGMTHINILGGVPNLLTVRSIALEEFGTTAGAGRTYTISKGKRVTGTLSRNSNDPLIVAFNRNNDGKGFQIPKDDIPGEMAFVNGFNNGTIHKLEVSDTVTYALKNVVPDNAEYTQEAYNRDVAKGACMRTLAYRNGLDGHWHDVFAKSEPIGTRDLSNVVISGIRMLCATSNNQILSLEEPRKLDSLTSDKVNFDGGFLELDKIFNKKKILNVECIKMSSIATVIVAKIDTSTTEDVDKGGGGGKPKTKPKPKNLNAAAFAAVATAYGGDDDDDSDEEDNDESSSLDENNGDQHNNTGNTPNGHSD
jgi:hypothetical protein